MSLKKRDFKNLHSGETCVVIGNGPSLNKVPKEFLDKHITFGSNKIFRLPYKPDYYTFADKTAMESCLPAIEAGWRPKRQMFLRAEACVKDNHPIYPVVLNGFSHNILNLVVMGGTATYVLLQIANYMGFKKIYLVGVDHHYRKMGVGKPGFFEASGKDPDHFVCGDGKPYYTPGDICMKPEDTTIVYRWAKEFFDKSGVEVINLTEGTKLDVFKKGNIKEY